ncbi:hypothetical protein BG004_006093 [Podila humilis]|nr:hypothetical protein BG004_006093 [Podila humilis]
MVRRDIVRASHVCREWRQLLTPIIWMSLDSSYDTACLEYTKFPLDRLRDLSPNIRYLNLHTIGFPAEAIVTTRLVELGIWARNLDRYKAVISANPKIATLKIFAFEGKRDKCQALSPLTAVKTLMLTNGVSGRKSFQQFLVRHRETLKEISFDTCSQDLNGMTCLGAEPFDNMRVIKFCGNLERNGGLFKLLHKCPNLKRLEVDTFKHSPSAWKGLGDHCPKISSVVFRVPWQDVSEFAHILAVECRSLTEISMTIARLSIPMEDAVLLHAESLEYLEVVFSAKFGMGLCSSVEILRKCQKLRSLSIHCTTPHNAAYSPRLSKEPLAASALETISLRGLVELLPAEAQSDQKNTEKEWKEDFDKVWVPVGSQAYDLRLISTAIQHLAKIIQDVPTMRTMDIDDQQFKRIRP